MAVALDPMIRFEALLGEPDANGCRRWLGFHKGGDPTSYGHFKVGGKKVIAHRWLLSQILGRPVQGEADHTCEHPWCCEPTHLQELDPSTTHALGAQQRWGRGRTQRRQTLPSVAWVAVFDKEMTRRWNAWGH